MEFGDLPPEEFSKIMASIVLENDLFQISVKYEHLVKFLKQASKSSNYWAINLELLYIF